MLIRTWGAIKDEIKSELDLDEETFIDDAELAQYANAAIDEAEQLVMSIYQGYFKTRSGIALTSGTAECSLPSDIYANKILRAYYTSGTNSYKIERIKESEIPFVQAADDIKYDLEWSGGVVKMILYPTPTTTALAAASPVKISYIANANRIDPTVATATQDAILINVPEAVNFIKAHVSCACLAKETGHPLYPVKKEDLASQRMLLRATLDSMVPDEDELIEQDMSFYDDFNDGGSRNDY